MKIHKVLYFSSPGDNFDWLATFAGAYKFRPKSSIQREIASALYFHTHISPKTVNSQMRENTQSHSDQNTHKTHSDQNTQKMHPDQNTNNLILIKTHKCTVS